MWLQFWSFLDRLLFGPASVGPRPPAVLLRVLRYPYAVARDLAHGDINLRAMGPILLVGFLGLSHATFGKAIANAETEVPFLQELAQWGVRISPYAMVTTLFMVMYMFVPNTRVRWKPALIGALAAGVIWAA